MKRHKTSYPGVFYREADRIGGSGKERVYYIVFKKNGKVIEERAGRQYADDMTPARAALIRGEKIEGKRKSKQQIREEKAAIRWTVDRLWQEYFKDKPSNKTWITERSRYQKHLKTGFGDKEAGNILPLDVHSLRINLSKTLTPQTVSHILRLLARIINFGSKKGLCQGLPFKIEYPSVNNIKTEDLKLEQLSRLLDAIAEEHDIQAANFMRIALFTGMRRGELFKLQWQDIDFDRGFIHIRESKGGQDQTIPLNDAARQVLESHPQTDSPFVFPGRDGEQRTGWPTGVHRIRKRAGLPKDFRPLHGLRHHFASQLASSGQVDMYTLQRLLTHKSPVMIQRYAHLRDEALKNASQLAGNLINSIAGGEKKASMAEGGKV